MNKDTLSVGNVIARLSAPTPSFWQKVKKVAAFVTGVAATVIAVSAAGVALPAAVITAAKVIGAMSSTSFIQASATVADAPQTPTDGSEQAAK